MRKKAEITVTEAAAIIHKGTQFVRLGLQQGRLPIGSAVQKPDGRWSYNIVPLQLCEYKRITIEELEKALAK